MKLILCFIWWGWSGYAHVSPTNFVSYVLENGNYRFGTITFTGVPPGYSMTQCEDGHLWLVPSKLNHGTFSIKADNVKGA